MHEQDCKFSLFVWYAPQVGEILLFGPNGTNLKIAHTYICEQMQKQYLVNELL